jgi:hypothetical protein
LTYDKETMELNKETMELNACQTWMGLCKHNCSLKIADLPLVGLCIILHYPHNHTIQVIY